MGRRFVTDFAQTVRPPLFSIEVHLYKYLYREAAHAPLLDVAYAHSPMNTSPPFAFPAEVQAIQADAKMSASDLGDAVVKLQKVLSYNYTFRFLC